MAIVRKDAVSGEGIHQPRGDRTGLGVTLPLEVTLFDGANFARMETPSAPTSRTLFAGLTGAPTLVVT